MRQFWLNLIIKYLLLIVLSLTVAGLIAFEPIWSLLGILVLILGVAIFLNPHLGLVIVILSMILGQAVRIPFPGLKTGVLIADLLLPYLIFVWLIMKLRGRIIPSPRSEETLEKVSLSLSAGSATKDSVVTSSIKANTDNLKNLITLPLVIFINIAFLSFLWGLRNLTLHETGVSFLYLVRFIEYAFLFYLTIDLVNPVRKGWALAPSLSKKDGGLYSSPPQGVGLSNGVKTRTCWNFYLKLLFVSGFLLATLGFLQLKFIPDFSFMIPQGWDPHQGRLLSTWFDPNFMGGFFAFILALVMGMMINSKFKMAPPGSRLRRQQNSKLKKKIYFILYTLYFILLFIALILTYSRSAFLAFVVSLFVLGLLKSRRLLILGLIALIIVVALSPRIQERLSGVRRLDETVRFRITSWLNTLQIVRDNWFLGVGYNAFRYAQSRYGFIEDPKVHSATGSDSSLLTVLATTGVFGLLVYFWLLVSILRVAWRTYRLNPEAQSSRLGLGFLAGFLGLIAHSQFTNSLLFPHLMETVWITLGLVVASNRLVQGSKFEVQS